MTFLIFIMNYAFNLNIDENFFNNSVLFTYENVSKFTSSILKNSLLIGSYRSIYKDYSLRKNSYIDFDSTKECKLTGLGVEYSGNIDETYSGKPCQSWLKNWDSALIINSSNEYSYGKKYPSYLFPGSFISKYKCRNPSKDLRGKLIVNSKSKRHISKIYKLYYIQDLGVMWPQIIKSLFSNGSIAMYLFVIWNFLEYYSHLVLIICRPI